MRAFIASVFAIAASLAASSSFASSTLEPTHISLPSGPGSIEGLGRNFAPSLASGTASYGVDIEVPPSAGGFGPHLSLDYDSGGGVSDVGIGWKISGLPSIRRRTENGLPLFVPGDPLEITELGIPCDLLEISSGIYRPEFESGAFVRVAQVGDGWEARTKAGTIYRFGGAGFTEAEGSDVATWLLNEEIDLHGHTIQYTWDTSTGHGVLQQVVWNDFGDDAKNAVAFSYETRPDPHTLYSAGIKQALTQRLTAVEVTHGGALVRRYALTYAPGIHSQLASVTLVGRDGTSTLPTLSLAYTQPSLAANGQVVTMQSPPGRTPGDPNIELTDLDGDSLPDLLVTLPGQYRSYVNHNGVTWDPGVDWDTSQSPSVELSTTGVQLADIDGDGAIDLVIKSGVSDFRYLPGNTATSFRPAVEIATVPDFTFEDPDTRIADMNGDRLVDVILTTVDGIAVGYNLGGTDWSVPALLGPVDPQQPLRFSDGGHTQLCDVNGDHVEDFCYLTSQSLVYWLGRGRGVFDPGQTANGVPSWDPSSPWELHDLDGDGWVDLVHVGVDEVDYALAIAQGEFGAQATISGVPTRDPVSTTIRYADMNGSGTTDIVWIDVAGDPSQAWQYLDLFPNGRAHLLAKIDNGLGKVTAMTYAPAALDAAASRDANVPWTSRLNLGMPVVKTVRTDASLGDPVMETDYAYANGTWSPVERTFAGFQGGTMTAVGDQYTPTLETIETFDVGIVDRTQRGLLLTDQTQDASGSIFSITANTYASQVIATSTSGLGVNYTYRSAEQVTHVERGPISAARVTLTEWAQDTYGNVTSESQWGEVVGANKLAGNDEAIKLNTYANDDQDWILGRIASEELQSAAGQRVRMKRSYYDGAPFVGLPLGQVSRGDLSRTEEWAGPDPSTFEPDMATSYDGDGNPLETRDARGGGHLFTWDPADHTSLRSESVKLGTRVLTEQATMDAAFGVLVSAVAYNGQTSTFQYDPFGRVTTIIKPGDSASSPTLSYQYNERAPLSRVTTDRRIWNDRADVEHAEAVIDGLGRTRALLTTGDTDGWVLGGVGFYGARGTAHRALRARFATQADHDNPPLQTDGAGDDTTYDASGREVSTRSQLGITTRTSYLPLVRQRWDGAQNDPSSPYEHTPVVDSSDGLGRIVSHSVTLKGQPLSATFTYDAAGSMLTKTDPEGNLSQYLYDGRGRRTTVIDPDMGKHTYDYDATSNITASHRPDGSVNSFTFDLAGRDLTNDWNGDGTPEVTYTWDQDPRDPKSTFGLGALAKVTDPSGSTVNEYDDRQRLTNVHRVIAGTEYDIANAYDAQDREYWHQYPDGSSLRTYRNARGLVSSYGQAVTFAYDGDGVELQRSFNTGATELTGYDDDRRVTERRATSAAGSVIEDLKWALDGASNITAVQDLRAGIDPTRDRSEAYGHDNLYRLTNATGTWGTAAWVYSPSGNLLSRTSSVALLDAGQFGYGASAGPHALTSFKGRTLAYDVVGRMQSDGDRTYAWDDVDQLTQVTASSGASVNSTFDSSGARRIRVEHNADGSSHSTYFVDASSEVRDGQLVRFITHGSQRIAKLAPTNGVAGASSRGDDASEPPGRSVERIAGLAQNLPSALIALVALVAVGARYRRRAAKALLYGAPLLCVALLAFGCSAPPASGPPPILNGTITQLGDADDLLFHDGIGSLSEQTNGSGQSKASFASYPYGVARYDTSDETRKYANAPRDEGVGLDQMGARSYAADLGVWTSGDPVRFSKPERATSMSFAADSAYTYAALAPTQFTDPTGRQAIPDIAEQIAESPEGIAATAILVSAAAKILDDAREALAAPEPLTGAAPHLATGTTSGAPQTVPLPKIVSKSLSGACTKENTNGQQQHHTIPVALMAMMRGKGMMSAATLKELSNKNRPGLLAVDHLVHVGLHAALSLYLMALHPGLKMTLGPQRTKDWAGYLNAIHDAHPNDVAAQRTQILGELGAFYKGVDLMANAAGSPCTNKIPDASAKFEGDAAKIAADPISKTH
jgi:RHS repeat-associated protein